MNAALRPVVSRRVTHRPWLRAGGMRAAGNHPRALPACTSAPTFLCKLTVYHHAGQLSRLPADQIAMLHGAGQMSRGCGPGRRHSVRRRASIGRCGDRARCVRVAAIGFRFDEPEPAAAAQQQQKAKFKQFSTLSSSMFMFGSVFKGAVGEAFLAIMSASVKYQVGARAPRPVAHPGRQPAWAPPSRLPSDGRL